MRVLVCSHYLQQREASARQTVAQASQALEARGFWSRVREVFLGPNASERQQYDRIETGQTEAQQWEKGRVGEGTLIQLLAGVLDDRYLYLAGYPSPRRRGDIDGVLIGPHGVTVFEVKAWHGAYHVSDDDWFFWSKKDQAWLPARGNPTKQALENAESLRALLIKVGLGATPIYPLVVMLSDYLQIEMDGPLSVPCIILPEQRLSVAELLGVGRVTRALSPQAVKKVADVLVVTLQVG